MHYFVQYAYLCTISILLYVRYNMHYFVQYAYFCRIFIRFLQNAYFCTNCILFKWVTRIRDVLCLLGKLIISVQHCTQCLTLCTTVQYIHWHCLNSTALSQSIGKDVQNPPVQCTHHVKTLELFIMSANKYRLHMSIIYVLCTF